MSVKKSIYAKDLEGDRLDHLDLSTKGLADVPVKVELSL